MKVEFEKVDNQKTKFKLNDIVLYKDYYTPFVIKDIKILSSGITLYRLEQSTNTLDNLLNLMFGNDSFKGLAEDEDLTLIISRKENDKRQSNKIFCNKMALQHCNGDTVIHKYQIIELVNVEIDNKPVVHMLYRKLEKNGKHLIMEVNKFFKDMYFPYYENIELDQIKIREKLKGK